MRLDSVIIRYDEIGLKSAPVRRQFVKVLIRNIRQKLGKNVKVQVLHSRLEISLIPATYLE